MNILLNTFIHLVHKRLGPLQKNNTVLQKPASRNQQSQDSLQCVEQQPSGVPFIRHDECDNTGCAVLPQSAHLPGTGKGFGGWFQLWAF